MSKMRPTECRDVELKRIWKRTCPILDIPSMIKLYIINSRKIIARVTLINHFISCNTNNSLLKSCKRRKTR